MAIFNRVCINLKTMRLMLWFLGLWAGSLLAGGCAVHDQYDERIPLIIDADTANEVDDLFALASAILEPRFNLLGITAAQFHTSPLASDTTALESHRINLDLLALMDRQDIPALLGSNEPISSHQDADLSPAAQFIIDQAHQYTPDHKLHIIILGPCTNMAAAIIHDSSIINLISVHYLGFWHEPETNVYDLKEFNSGNDTIAVNLLLNTEGLEMDVMTATTSQHLIFKKKIVDQHLSEHPGLGQYLIERWNNYNRWWTRKDPEKREWIMWDVAIVEALARPELSTEESFTTPPENTKRYIGIHTDIEIAAMEKVFWGKLDDFINREHLK